MAKLTTLTLPQEVIDHVGYLVEINNGAWSGYYRKLRPYLTDPKPDPSTPIE